MSREEDNKVIVGRWFADFWGKTCNLGIVDELAAPDMLLMHFNGTTVLKLKDGKITEEIGLDNGVIPLQQLGLIRTV